MVWQVHKGILEVAEMPQDLHREAVAALEDRVKLLPRLEVVLVLADPELFGLLMELSMEAEEAEVELILEHHQ
jgi:hypothetical protein